MCLIREQGIREWGIGYRVCWVVGSRQYGANT